MEYSINKLAKMSGISTRTLRYYDEIGLLKPLRVNSSGYRIYGQDEVDILQQILFFRELKFSLEDIKLLLAAPHFDREKAFENHLFALNEERKRLDMLIYNIKQSIAAMKGEINMTDNEKFNGFKQQMIDENEKKYGDEIRQKYGEKDVNDSNRHLNNLSKERYDELEHLRLDMEKTLKAAFETKDPAGELAQRACELHRQWLSILYPGYSKEYHKGLGEMYVADERFRVNYDKLGAGCTEFLRDAINIFCK